MRLVCLVACLFFVLGAWKARFLSGTTLGHFFSKLRAGHWMWIILFGAIVNIGKIESESIYIANLRQLILMGFISFFTLVTFFARIRLVLDLITLPIIFLIIYGVLGIISGVYSPFPEFSVYKASIVIVATLLGCVVSSYGPAKESVKLLIRGTYLFYLLLCLSFLLGSIIDPVSAFEKNPGMLVPMLKGWIIITNPNTVGMVSGAIVLVCLVRLFRKTGAQQKTFLILLLSSSSLLAILAQSRGALFALTVGVVVLMVIEKKYLTLLLLALLGTGMLASDSWIGRKYLETYVRRGVSEEHWETWSGRKIAWRVSLEELKKRPLLGYGMAAGVRFGAVSKSYIGSHLHNSYFEVLVNSGLIGFIPWFLSVVGLGVALLRSLIFRKRLLSEEEVNDVKELFILYTFFIARSITGTTFVYLDYSMMMLISMLCYMAALSKGPKRRLGHQLPEH